MHKCTLCGQLLIEKMKCDVCEAGEKELMISYVSTPGGKVVAWWIDGTETDIEPSGRLKSSEFAELVRQQRRCV